MEKQLLPHQQRVITEKEELDEKITKLNAFFRTDIFEKLHYPDQDLLRKQWYYMTCYSDILKTRIENFTL